MLDRVVHMLASADDTDAVMGLRALQAHIKSEGVDFTVAINALIAQLPQLKTAVTASPQLHTAMSVPQPAAAASPAATGGFIARNGALELVADDGTPVCTIALPALAADHASVIAASLKDAVVAATINKCRMKIKLLDVKNGRGEVTETQLRAEYDRPGMTPVPIWVNNRGDVAALAAVLRPALAQAVPHLMG